MSLLRFDCFGLDHDELAHRPLVEELDASRNLGEERIVLAAAHVQPRLYPRSALADDNRPAGNQLSAKCLEAKPLRVRVATVS